MAPERKSVIINDRWYKSKGVLSMRGNASKSESDATKMGASLNSKKYPIDRKVPGNLKIPDQTVNIYLARRGADGR